MRKVMRRSGPGGEGRRRGGGEWISLSYLKDLRFWWSLKFCLCRNVELELFLKKNLEGQCAFVSLGNSPNMIILSSIFLYIIFFPRHTLFLLKQYCVSARGRGLKGLSFGGFGLKKKNSPMEAKIKRICRLKKCMPRITDKLMSWLGFQAL